MTHEKFHQKIKLAVLTGYVNACKTFKAKMYIIKNLLPLISENIRCYRNEMEEYLIEGVIRLLIASGGIFDRSVFIPGESREN